MFCLKRQLERAMSAAPLASSMYLSKDSGVDGENHWFMFLLRFYLSPTSKHHMSQGMSVQHLLPKRVCPPRFCLPLFATQMPHMEPHVLVLLLPSTDRIITYLCCASISPESQYHPSLNIGSVSKWLQPRTMRLLHFFRSRFTV